MKKTAAGVAMSGLRKRHVLLTVLPLLLSGCVTDCEEWRTETVSVQRCERWSGSHCAHYSSGVESRERCVRRKSTPEDRQTESDRRAARAKAAAEADAWKRSPAGILAAEEARRKRDEEIRKIQDDNQRRRAEYDAKFPLRAAAFNGEVEKVRALLAAGVDPNTLDEKRDNAAIEWVAVGIKIADFNDPEPNSALALSIYELLIRAGADINIMVKRSPHATTTLHRACQTVHPTLLLRYLIDQGAKINVLSYAGVDKATPLDQCIRTASKWKNTAASYAAKIGKSRDDDKMLKEKVAKFEAAAKDAETAIEFLRSKGAKREKDLSWFER